MEWVDGASIERIDGAELLRRLRDPLGDECLTGLLLVDCTGPAPGEVDRLSSLPVVVAALGEPGPGWSAAVDVLVDEADAGALAEAFGRNPIAATALAVLLRGSERRSLGDGLAAESAVYSALQAGPEFERWRRTNPPRSRQEPDTAAVEATRDGDRLCLTLNRPHVRNSFNRRMREDLLDALAVASADPGITVEIRGAGPAFCAGGDLDEFGSRPDPASAHLVRLERSVGRMISSIRDRVIAYVHGACYGSGIELPAFAGRVVAAPDTRIALPEVGLGLVPGAGGTVSLVRRAGRHRVAWLALLGRAIDARTALDWGLVDDVAQPGGHSARSGHSAR